MTAPYCYVNTTSGSTTVTWASGGNVFPTGSGSGTSWANQQIQLGNTSYTVTSVASASSMTLSSTATATQLSVPLYTSNALTNTFYSGDWVLRLLPIQYSVNTSNTADPNWCGRRQELAAR